MIRRDSSSHRDQRNSWPNIFLLAMKRESLLRFTEAIISQVYMPRESVKYMCDKHISTIYITQSLDIGQA